MRSRRIRRLRSPTDEEPTLEALPEEPTLSRDAPDLTVPGATAVLVDTAPWEDGPAARDHTLPMPRVLSAPPSAPPSVPVVDDPVGLPPGVGEHRRTVRRIALGTIVLSTLVCVVALGVIVVRGLKGEESRRGDKTAVAVVSAVATSEPAPSATSSAPPPIPDVASATTESPPPPSASPSKIASKPEPTAPRVEAAHPAAIPRRPPPPVQPKPRTDIVRTAPF